jgi:alginate O-acetyltransferase complex protein AlgI
MSLVSPVFFLCVLPFVVAFHLLPARLRPLCLLAASYVFYAAVDVRWAALLAALTVVAYVAARVVEGEGPRRGAALAAALAALLGVLAFFKYGRELAPGPLGSVVAPLGLSYYLFKLTSYVIDVYWKKLPACRDPVAFGAYAAFFPQLPSGPIQRAGDFLGQLARPSASVAAGLRAIVFGLFQKLIVAERVGQWVDPVYAAGGASHGPVAALVATYAFGLQLYADFGGVTDIAIGLGRLFGIEGPPNFRTPWAAESVPEFWRRWHMSLTSWLTDYVFLPLRMLLRNAGQAGLVVSIVVNMVLVGLWHGATGPFLALGLINGVYVAASTLTAKRRDKFFKRRPRLARARALWRPVVTAHLMLAGLVFFRAPSLGVAVRVLGDAARGVAELLLHGARVDWAALDFSTLGHSDPYVIAFGVAVLWLARRRPDVVEWILARPRWVRWTWYYLAVGFVLLLGKLQTSAFIYQQF